MADLIDRQAAISEIEEYADRLQMVNWKENPGVPYKVHALNWCVNTIRDLPSTDAVEVVRCKDCKHSTEWYRDKRRCFLWCEDGIDVFEDGYCSYGRK